MEFEGMGSQITGLKEPLEVIWSNSKLKQKYTEKVVREHVLLVFWISLRRRFPRLQASCCRAQSSLQYVQKDSFMFQFVLSASCSITEHHWRVWLWLYNFVSDIYIHFYKVP